MFLKILTFVLFLELKVFPTSEAARKQIFCESILNEGSWPHVGVIRICLMRESTSIFAKDVETIPKLDDSVIGLSFYGNKKIHFPPLGIDKTFSNLQAYNFESCSVESVSRQAFANLRNLRVLWLNDNQIEGIPSDSFDDLLSLEWLYLSQ